MILYINNYNYYMNFCFQNLKIQFILIINLLFDVFYNKNVF